MKNDNPMINNNINLCPHVDTPHLQARFASNPTGFPFARLAATPYVQSKDIMSGTFIEHVWC